MRDFDHTAGSDWASGGARVIAGLVVVAVIFLILLLLFGDALFSGGKVGADHPQQPRSEASTE
jgi:hypothetical protein